MDILSTMDYIQKNYETLTKSISFFSKNYQNISIPIRNNFAYDLLIEDRNRNILRVKTLHTECKSPSGTYIVSLRSFGGYRKGKELKKEFDKFMCDLLFIECPDGFYVIPSQGIENKRAISLSQFQKFKTIPS